ncbi:MAG: GNAT family N-acetyltransferase [Anaerolineae bacterium]|nr:GNAT family N-acetyltransferase [Anaerolineae bacterium]
MKTQATHGSCYWQGDKVRLRAWEPSDAEHLWSAQWDSEAIRVLEAGIDAPRSREQLRAWIARDATEDHPNVLRFVIETFVGEPVGWANLRDWQSPAGTFSFAVRVYREYQRQGYAGEAVRILLRYGFHELRCQKANSVTISSNTASIEMHRRLGFVEEGRLRRNAYTDGRYWDEVLFGMTREEFDARYQL